MTSLSSVNPFQIDLHAFEEAIRLKYQKVDALPHGLREAELASLKAATIYAEALKNVNLNAVKAPSFPASSGILPVAGKGLVLLALVHKSDLQDPAHGTYATLAGRLEIEDFQDPKIPACVKGASREGAEEAHFVITAEKIQQSLMASKALMLPNAKMEREGKGFFSAPIFAVHIKDLTDEDLSSLLNRMNAAAQEAVKKNPNEEAQGYALFSLNEILKGQAEIDQKIQERKAVLEKQHAELTSEERKQILKADPELRALNVASVPAKIAGTETVVRVNSAACRTFKLSPEALKQFVND